MAFRGKEKHRKIVLTKEYLEARNSEDLKKFQAEAVKWRQAAEDAKAEYASIQAKIKENQEDHKKWLIEKTKEIQVEAEELRQLELDNKAAHDERLEQLQEKLNELKAAESSNLSALRKVEETKKESDQKLRDAQASDAEAIERQKKISRDLTLKQTILDNTRREVDRNKGILADLEAKRNELLQQESRIDAGLEATQKEADRNESIVNQYIELKAECDQKLAQIKDLDQREKEVEKDKAEVATWRKTKADQESDLEDRKRQADIREKAQDKREENLIKRETNLKQLEKESTP